MTELQQSQLNKSDDSYSNLPNAGSSKAAEALAQLPIKGRAPKTGYTRSQFSEGWDSVPGCDIRNLVLARDLTQVTFLQGTCKVTKGLLQDPYTGVEISFLRGQNTSDTIQIDHVVALSDAWQKGAQLLSYERRHALANDELDLLAVDGTANNIKGDGDAATWLPKNKIFRCAYVARQIAVKKKYSLWVTRSEYDAIANVLNACPDQPLPDDGAAILAPHALQTQIPGSVTN